MKKVIMFFALVFSLFAGSRLVQADNPIIKERFTADPAALVHDGKVYLYVGHDQAKVNDPFFVLKEWNIYSSSNLIDWQLEGDLPRTEFSWGKGASAWASQAVEKNGSFYWYVTVLHADSNKSGYAIGVAKADSPIGDFKDAIGAPLITSDMTDDPEFMGAEPWDDIDPTVFIDDDGQAYLYWGNTHLYYVKLKENMVEVSGEIKRVNIDNMQGSFTEGPWLHKYNHQYYLSFAMNYPEEIGYATSDHPEGPWTFQGKILEQLPDSSTSHPAIIEFEDNWYFIYHTAALPTGGEFRRSVSIEKLSYDADGKINKLTPTASGVQEKNVRIRPYRADHKYVRAKGMLVDIANEKTDMTDFEWYITPGLLTKDPNHVSFQVENKPGYYMKRKGKQIIVAKNDGTEEFKQAATFKQIRGAMDSKAFSYTAFADETLYIAIENEKLVLKPVDTNLEKKMATFHVYDHQANEIHFTGKSDEQDSHNWKGYWLLSAILFFVVGLIIYRKHKKGHT